jgi:glycosyltransferase involved in cell wall biosynthesis
MELTRSLADLPRGNEMELFTAGSQFPLTKELDLHNISLPGCRLLPGLITVGNGLIPLVACRRGLDIVHDPTGVTPFLFGAGGARTVVTVHDVFAWSCPGTSTFLDTIIYRHWLPRVLPTVDAVITVSQVSKGDITRYLNIPTSKIRIIYEGVSGAYHPLPAGKVTRIAVQHGLPGNYILFVGSVEKRKNLRGLLQAYAHLRTMGEPPPLVVVGARRGRGNGITETLREHDLKPHVVFLGYVPDEDLPALYSGADLFVFPSHYEGFGLPPLEAMACGTPVVCSNTSSLPEVVGDAAIMVDPTNVEALAEAMHRVLTDGDLRQHMREKGLARAKQFTWERCARETLAVYQEVCG